MKIASTWVIAGRAMTHFSSASRHVAMGTALLLLAVSGCVQMPVPTSPAPPGSTAPAPTTSAAGAVAPVPATPAQSQTPAAAPSVASATSNGKGDAANGAKLFAAQPCSGCHDVTHPFPGGVICPNLGNVATEAERIVHSPDYHGKATDAAGYIRESIVDPNAYIVPGDKYHTTDGQSVMPKNFGQTLTPSQIDDLVAYLMTLK